MIKFYNSLTKKKETFKPIIKNEVKIYTCGPTVYNYVHIGNLRAYVFADILVRTLKYFNYKVINVLNITDVDDKTIRDSKKEFKETKATPNQILKQFTDKYKAYFLEDLYAMNIEKPKMMPHATESIKDMEFLIQKLVEKKFAYIGEDGIYFDLTKAKDYGKLVNIDFDKQRYNKKNRLNSDEYEKDNAQDFALWKFKKENDEPFWTITISNHKYKGRPGWHIECSAMSFAYLGKVFDIHTGGVDLKFPHHENEICQSSCALGIDNQAKYWMHNEHLLVNNKKMSKSLRNFYTLRDLEEKGFSALALREVYLRSHYRQQVNFTLESLSAGQTNVKKINDFYKKLKNMNFNENSKDELNKIYDQRITGFEKALKDDLNTQEALVHVYEFMNQVNKKSHLSESDLKLTIEFMQRVDRVLALLETEEDMPKKVVDLANKRVEARNNKNWEESDNLRAKIKELGYEIKDSKDTKSGYILSKS